ncbi:MAG: SDR family oxidoreductase [Phycisphaerales bacterium]
MNARPVAVITGATAPGRVGLAIATELARAGCNLVLTHRPGASAERLAAATKHIEEAVAAGPAGAGSAMSVPPANEPGRTIVRFEAIDLADAAAAGAWAGRLAESLPRVDVLVHNASAYESSPLGSIDAGAVEGQFAVNACSPLMISAALGPALAASPMGLAEGVGAAIVTLCDAHALGADSQPRTRHAAYSMSKAALLEMTMVLARELSPHVRVNAVAPGVVAFARHEDEAFQSRYLARVPLARAGVPEDAARAVRWLALEATYCTGEVIRLDGGRHLT